MVERRGAEIALPFLPRLRKGALATPGGAEMQYLFLGDGPLAALVIPGAGDGLAMVADAAWRLAVYYRRRAHTHRLLLLSRRQPIPENYSVAQHAEDYLWAMDQLGWGASVLECNSGGGPIGQVIAVRQPDRVRGLILASTGHRLVGEDMAPGRALVEYWDRLALAQRWAELQWSSIEATFRPRTVARYRLARPLLRLVAAPRDPWRLHRIFAGLLTVDHRPLLPRIACPTLVIAGEDDPLFPPFLQREMGRLIPDSQVLVYPGYKHGNDQENPAYEYEATRFMRTVEPHRRAR